MQTLPMRTQAQPTSWGSSSSRAGPHPALAPALARLRHVPKLLEARGGHGGGRPRAVLAARRRCRSCRPILLRNGRRPTPGTTLSRAAMWSTPRGPLGATGAWLLASTLTCNMARHTSLRTTPFLIAPFFLSAVEAAGACAPLSPCLSQFPQWSVMHCSINLLLL